MPYVWHDNPVHLKHKGVEIYNVFKDDMESGGVKTFWFGLLPHGGEESEDTFDVRDLKAWPTKYGFSAGPDEINAVLKAAIESGEILPPYITEMERGLASLLENETSVLDPADAAPLAKVIVEWMRSVEFLGTFQR